MSRHSCRHSCCIFLPRHCIEVISRWTCSVLCEVAQFCVHCRWVALGFNSDLCGSIVFHVWLIVAACCINRLRTVIFNTYLVNTVMVTWTCLLIGCVLSFRPHYFFLCWFCLTCSSKLELRKWTPKIGITNRLAEGWTNHARRSVENVEYLVHTFLSFTRQTSQSTLCGFCLWNVFG